MVCHGVWWCVVLSPLSSLFLSLLSSAPPLFLSRCHVSSTLFQSRRSAPAGRARSSFEPKRQRSTPTPSIRVRVRVVRKKKTKKRTSNNIINKIKELLIFFFFEELCTALIPLALDPPFSFCNRYRFLVTFFLVGVFGKEIFLVFSSMDPYVFIL